MGESFVEKILSLLSFLEKLATNGRIKPGQVSKQLLACWVVLEEVEALALPIFDGQALNIVVNQRGKVRVWLAELGLALL